jgi:hypothetical protein
MITKEIQAVYFREPACVLFEIATNLPGFAIVEKPEELGSCLLYNSVMLPSTSFCCI